MKKLILVASIVAALSGCGADSATENRAENPGELLNQLLETNAINISADAEFSAYIQREWSVTAYPLNGQEERPNISPISFIDGEIEADDSSLIVFGTIVDTYENAIAPVYEMCDAIVTEGPQVGRYVIENPQLVGSAIKTGDGPDAGFDFGPTAVTGFNYVDSYEIIDTGFDTLLKINAQAEHYPQCCVTENGTCEGFDSSVIINSASKTYAIKAANDQGFVIESDGYYIVFMIQP